MEPAVSGLSFKNRKATSVHNCLAIKERPHYVNFNMETAMEFDSEEDMKAMGGIVKVIQVIDRLFKSPIFRRSLRSQ